MHEIIDFGERTDRDIAFYTERITDGVGSAEVGVAANPRVIGYGVESGQRKVSADRGVAEHVSLQ